MKHQMNEKITRRSKNKKKRINLIKEFSVLLKYKKRTKEVSLLSEKFIELFQSELVLFSFLSLFSTSNFFQPHSPLLLVKKVRFGKATTRKKSKNFTNQSKVKLFCSNKLWIVFFLLFFLWFLS